MSNDIMFSTLLSDNTNTDNYVNATKLCQSFNKDVKDYKRWDKTKAFIQAVQNKIGNNHPVLKVKRGKGGGTYVHPLVAIHLAEWLNPDFSVYVKTTFKSYLEKDIKLADNILQRQTDIEKVKWLKARVEGKIVRQQFTEELKERGVTGHGYAMNTDAINKEIFDHPAKELKAIRKVENTRDGLSQIELAGLQLAELVAIKRMKEQGATGNTETTKCSKQAGKDIRKVIE